MDLGLKPAESISRDRVRGVFGRIGDRIRARFEVDTRSLAALRISLGLIIIFDLVHRAGDMGFFYTDSGVYPLSAFESTYIRYNDITIHALSGDLWFQQVMFLVAGILALVFILGYRTRLVGVISLILLFSLHGRNPAVLNGGDRLLRVLFFVALVAPLGERWSIDALRRGSARKSVVSFGTAVVLVQPIVVFTSNAIQKHAGDEWYAGDGIEVALHNDAMTVFLGDVIVEYPLVMTALNYTWIILIAGSLFFLLVPVGRIRALAAFAYMGAFAGMVVTVTVGLFPLVLTASVIPFLTSPFWDTVARPVPSGWHNRLPEKDQLGCLGRRPLEYRILESLRERGHTFTASYAVAFGKSFLTVAGFLVLVWILVFSAIDISSQDVPEEIDDHLDQQSWGLYAPDPTDSYSWYPVGAELENGTEVDALEGGELDLDRPEEAAAEYETFRHRKFMQKLGDSTTITESYARWACKRANEVQDGRVEKVTVYRMRQESPIDGEYDDPIMSTVVEDDCVSEK